MRKTRKMRGGAAKKPKARCQCMNAATDTPCRKIALFGSLFCLEHAHCPMSPQSGAEPQYEPETWNNDEATYKSMNCYAYAFNYRNPVLIGECRRNNGKDCRKYFPQPGALNGDRNALNASERRSCPVVEQLMTADVPEIKKSSFSEKCGPGESKIALVVDPGEDYHFYRKDKGDVFWSHKDGSNKVKRFDALRRRIFNPAAASRDYRWQGSDLNYTDFCGFYCVPRNHPIPLGQGGERLAASAEQQAQQQAPAEQQQPQGGSAQSRRRQAAGAHPRVQTRRRLRSGLPW
jgi:hypothetical protein